MKVKAIMSLNENIKKDGIYTLKETKHGILLLYYTTSNYYLLSRSLLEKNFIIL